MRFQERRFFNNIKMRGETARANVETAASYLGDLSPKMNKSGYAKQHYFQCR